MNSPDLSYIKRVLASCLGKVVLTPKGKMYLVELYSNGNVGCLPLDYGNYEYDLREFNALSVYKVDKT